MSTDLREPILSFVKAMALLFLFGLTFCHKKNERPAEPLKKPRTECVPHTHKIIRPELLQCKFLERSWWAFKDSLSGNYDTLELRAVSQSTLLTPPSYSPCEPSELYNMIIEKMHEPEGALKTFTYGVVPFGVILMNPNFWGNEAAPAVVDFASPVETMIINHDSLYLSDRYYYNVSQTPELTFTRSLEPNMMVLVSLRIYFNTEFGPIQFEYRDWQTGELKSRYKLVDRVILR